MTSIYWPQFLHSHLPVHSSHTGIPAEKINRRRTRSSSRDFARYMARRWRKSAPSVPSAVAMCRYWHADGRDVNVFFWGENAPAEEEETIEFEAEEREGSDSEESNTYDVSVQGERLVVSKEVRDALLKIEEDEMLLISECVSFVNNDFDSNLCEDLVRGFVTSMSKNVVNTEMSVTPFSAKKVKVKALLKWIIGPAVARNQAGMLPPRPLH